MGLAAPHRPEARACRTGGETILHKTRVGEAGFTLLGLLAVLIMVGIVSAIAQHNLGRASGRYAVREQARRVHAELATARARAVAEGIDQSVALRGGERLEAAARTATGWRAVAPPVRLADHVSVRIDASPDGRVVFGPLGQVDRPHAILVSGGDEDILLRILASGTTAWDR